MPIIAENNSTPRVNIPAGNHIARCIEMIHIGTIMETTGQFAGKFMNKVRLSWETPDELYDFGKGMQPFIISKEFTLSMSEKATLRKMLESWRGKAFSDEQAKAFDITVLLGKPCMLSVIHKVSKKGSTYADISSIASLPKGFECPAQVNPSKVLSYDDWKQEIFDGLPDFVKDKIKASQEYKAMLNPGVTETNAAPVEIEHDDLPF